MLTLENICPYLPYGLKILHEEFEMEGSYTQVVTLSTAGEECLTFTDHKWGASDYHYEVQSNPEVKPILRHMDLTKPIIVEGKEIIPIVELAKISYPSYTWFYDIGAHNAKTSGNSHGFEYNETGFEMYNQISGGFLPVKNQLALFQWLFKHKFDVFGLIEKGLAIDVNTLTTNPYN